MDSDLVAVVDDSPTVRKAIEVTLHRAGYEVKTFASAEKAVDWLEHSQVVPDLFLVDILLPKMNGYSLISYLHAKDQFSQKPFVILSRCHGLVDILKGKLVGASGHVAKPFKAAELVSVVAKHLGMPAVVRSF